MTNTPISEREKELVETMREVIYEEPGGFGRTTQMRDSLRVRANLALRAYDPKPEPVPVIPAWEEFVKGKEQIWLIGPDDKTPCGVRLRKNGIAAVWREDYDLLRTLTSKAPTE